MHERVLHIHLGASKLALGLILPIATEVGLETHLIGRPGPGSRPAYGVALVPSRPISFFPLASFGGPFDLAGVDPRIAEALQDGDPMLITSTLRGAISQRYEFVSELLEARHAEDDTVFIACENSLHPAYEDLRKKFEPAGVQFLSTVVNRICPRFLPPSHGRRVVLAHEVGEWLIEEPERPAAFQALLERSDLVRFHKKAELEALEERKRWVVNGGQLYLAMLAHDAGEKSLTKAARSPLRDPMTHFHAEANRVLALRHPDLSDDLPYALMHGKAFCEIADNVPRMVAMQRADLTPFFRNFERRIGEPARLAAGQNEGKVPPIFLRALEILDSLLGKRRAYDFSDPHDPEKPATLDRNTDARAVEAYRNALRGWVPADEIKARVRRLDLILSSHRRGQEPPSGRRIGPA